LSTNRLSCAIRFRVRCIDLGFAGRCTRRGLDVGCVTCWLLGLLRRGALKKPQKFCETIYTRPSNLVLGVRPFDATIPNFKRQRPQPCLRHQRFQAPQARCAQRGSQIVRTLPIKLGLAVLMGACFGFGTAQALELPVLRCNILISEISQACQRRTKPTSACRRGVSGFACDNPLLRTWGRQRGLRILVDDPGLCSVVARHDAEDLDTTERHNRLRVLEVSCIPIAEGRKRRSNLLDV